MAALGNREYDAAFQQFIRETQDENVRLRGENASLRTLSLLQQQHLEVCHDKYGEDCHEPYAKPDVCIPILPSPRMPPSYLHSHFTILYPNSNSKIAY